MSNSSEHFRTDLLSKLPSSLNKDQLEEILFAIDAVSSNYDISEKSTSLITVDQIPEIVKIYLASKAIENCSMQTLYQYKYKLLDFFNTVKKPFSDISTNDIRVYLYNYKMAHGIGDSTLDHMRRCINSFFQWLRVNDYIAQNPAEKIAVIKHQQAKRHPLDAYDLELLRWYCKDVREKAIIDFLYSTGCRVGELIQIKKSDVSWTDHSVQIHHGKGDKSRIIFFNAESAVTLQKYLEQRTDDNEFLFVSLRKPHHSLSTRGVQAIVKKIRDRCVEVTAKVTPHIFRHTFATTSLKNGMPIEQLQTLMGHSKPETTLIYAKIDTTDLRLAHERAFT